jgi:hypothetical protein
LGNDHFGRDRRRAGLPDFPLHKEEIMKRCMECIHYEGPYKKPPCSDCFNHAHWESRESRPPYELYNWAFNELSKDLDLEEVKVIAVAQRATIDWAHYQHSTSRPEEYPTSSAWARHFLGELNKLGWTVKPRNYLDAHAERQAKAHALLHWWSMKPSVGWHPFEKFAGTRLGLSWDEFKKWEGVR